MLYKKDPKLKYTDMCIYIDNHIYTDDYDEELVFSYLYQLSYVLAMKKHFFTNIADYDSYAIYCAGVLFKRLKNPKQFLPDTDTKKIPKIKSILNYIKRIMYPLKVNYQQDNFQQSFDVDVRSEEGITLRETLVDKARNSCFELLDVEVECCLGQITNTIKDFINQLPYCNDKIISKNIYISCLLTFLKSIVWNNSNNDRLISRQERSLSLDSLINTIYENELKTILTLYHLPNSMSEYIKVLTNRIKKLISKDIMDLIQYRQPSDDVIKTIIASTLEDFGGDDNYD